MANLNNLNPAQRALINGALKDRASALRREVTECARAMGRWDDKAVQGLVDEAAAVDGLAELFK